MQSLYIHIPFCAVKCFYCSFAINVNKEYAERYLECLVEEMQRGSRVTVSSVYLGGGTPSLLTQDQLLFLLERVNRSFVISPEKEFTVEANPEHVDLSKMKALRSWGVNRISLGAQTFNDERLRALGRNHTGYQIFKAYEIIREAGFDNVNIDLLYGTPGQDTRMLREDLECVVKMDCEHVAVYALTLEPGSLFHTRKVRARSREVQAEQFSMVREFLIDAGYEHYEVSNFAKIFKRSVHNVNYWSGGNYQGLGMAAHSHFDGRRFWNVSSLFRYMELMEQGLDPKESQEILPAPRRLVETLLFGLRMKQGINLNELQKRYGCTLDASRVAMIREWIAGGFLQEEAGNICATQKGQLVLDELCERLV